MTILLLDILFTSITNISSSFLVFDIYKKHNIFYIIITSILAMILTQKTSFLVLIIFIYYFIRYLKKYINNKYVLYFISYLLLFNINVNIINLLFFILSVLIVYLNPYN